MQFSLIGNGDDQNIVVFVPGQSPKAAHSSHPMFDAIVAGARAGDPAIIDLFDVSKAVESKFLSLSDRITVRNGSVYIDGDEADGTIVRQIVRFLDQGVDDWQPLVAFIENLLGNENEHSVGMLYDWLEANGDFAIDAEGYIIGYKGVADKGDGTFTSINSGRAIVNGVEVSGRIPQTVGDVVTMPRSEVQHDPSVGCHTGLHVGTYEYARNFAQGALLLVRVNPRDVVSVPTDCSAQKMRCCKYEVVAVIPQTVTAPLSTALYDQDEDYWGDGEDDLDFGF